MRTEVVVLCVMTPSSDVVGYRYTVSQPTTRLHDLSRPARSREMPNWVGVVIKCRESDHLDFRTYFTTTSYPLPEWSFLRFQTSLDFRTGITVSQYRIPVCQSNCR